MKKVLIRVFILLLIFSIGFACQEKNKARYQPSTDTRILDNIELLSTNQKEELYKLIIDLESKTGSQIGIVIVDTLRGEKIEVISLEMAEKLDLGRDKYKDGLVIFFSKKDKEIRIEVGFGLERIIRDEISNDIIYKTIIPQFKSDKYYEGLSDAVNRISKLIIENKELIGRYP